MSPEYIAALNVLDRSDVLYREFGTNLNGCGVTSELCAQPDGTITLHTFSDDPEDADNFDVEQLDGLHLISWLRDHWSNSAARLAVLQREA